MKTNQFVAHQVDKRACICIMLTIRGVTDKSTHTHACRMDISLQAVETKFVELQKIDSQVVIFKNHSRNSFFSR